MTAIAHEAIERRRELLTRARVVPLIKSLVLAFRMNNDLIRQFTFTSESSDAYFTAIVDTPDEVKEGFDEELEVQPGYAFIILWRSRKPRR
jgi:hypothetical protein